MSVSQDHLPLSLRARAAAAYSIMRGEMSAGERATFAEKILNDVGDSCNTWYMHFAPGSSVNGGTMDFNDSARTATATCGTATCRLVAHWLTPDGGPETIARVDNANGTYTGGANRTFRITTCPGSAGTCATNATAGEQLSVFKPSLSEADTLSTARIDIDANWTGVEIKDSDPKAAVFHRGGTTGDSVSFTTTFTGTGQYLVSGLTAGTYSATIDGSPASGSPCTVVSDDNTCYFEGSAGAVVLAAEAGAASSGRAGGNARIGGAARF